MKIHIIKIIFPVRLQEAMVQQNNCTNNWKNFKYKLQLQDNESNTSTEKKLILCYNLEQQRLILENENLKSRLLTIEKEKCDIAASAAQLENKLLLQEEKMQNVLSAHEEKKILVKKQQRLLSEFESLQFRINMLEKDKTNITEMVIQNRNRNVGITSTIKNYVSLTSERSKILKNAAWDVSHNACEAYFNFCVPLNMLLGFCGKYKRIVINARYELILIRSCNDNNCLVKHASVEAEI